MNKSLMAIYVHLEEFIHVNRQPFPQQWWSLVSPVWDYIRLYGFRNNAWALLKVSEVNYIEKLAQNKDIYIISILITVESITNMT